MAQALSGTNFTFPNQTAVYHGKVRDVYTIAEKYMVMVASDRISAFDHILPKGIPYKGQVLNQIAAMFLQATQDIVPNWWLASPDPNVSVGLRCEPYKVEMVIRGYLAGHAAREYAAGKRILCGVPLPDGLQENDALSEPIITPTTKATEGHDMDISREAIIAGGIVLENEYLQLEHYTRSLFQRGSEMARERGLILVDTKYEFGKDANGTIRLIDEIHTPDSSRYFYLEGYQERQDRGEVQKQLSKEFVRQWLIANGFQGLEGQKMPEMPDEFVQTVTERYVELYERITGKRFEPSDTREIVNRVYSNTVDYTNQLIP
jgi:phosphoribosylaminoimidazole-succinocarboxamide synthase